MKKTRERISEALRRFALPPILGGLMLCLISNNSWPWTRLGYTYDYENSANSPVGLSEYVAPSCSDTNYWGAGMVIPI